MDKRKQQQIENLLKQTLPVKAPKSFTDKVMSDLHMLSNEELLKDDKLASLLKKSVLEQPSPNFLSNVMTKVEVKSEFTYQPIISKRSWFFILASTIAVIAYVLYTGTPSKTPSIYIELTPYLEKTQLLWQNMSFSFDISPLLTLSLFSLTFLVLVDYISRIRSYA